MVVYGLASLYLFLEFEIKDHDLFKDLECKTDAIIRFHKKVYANRVDNQRLTQALRLTIPEDVLREIEQLPRFEKYHAYQFVLEHVRNFLNKIPRDTDEFIFSFDHFSEFKKDC